MRSDSPRPRVWPPLPGDTPGWQRWGEDVWDGRDAMGDGDKELKMVWMWNSG